MSKKVHFLVMVGLTVTVAGSLYGNVLLWDVRSQMRQQQAAVAELTKCAQMLRDTPPAERTIMDQHMSYCLTLIQGR